MKLVVIFACYVTLCFGKTIPQIPNDNSHYVEGESRYIWMSRDDGEPTLVDLQEPVTADLKSVGANNQYWLYTRKNPDEYQLLIPGDSSTVTNSHFQSNKPTHVLIHGWSEQGGRGLFNRVTKAALLEAEDCNVIVVDWHGLASGLYVIAVNGVPSVGESVGHFLIWLLDTTAGYWNNVHLFGFSLGAHVVGNAGRTVGGRVARITGFDPAGPLWWTHPNRLDRSNGQYVEAIHTNGGVMGILDPVGHVDFYPNGGVTQPGCFSNNCFHDRAYEFFAASVTTGHLVGRECSSVSEALSISNRCAGNSLTLGGIDMNKRASGLYGLRTGRAWPF